jgi:hypothetical protein
VQMGKDFKFEICSWEDKLGEAGGWVTRRKSQVRTV